MKNILFQNIEQYKTLESCLSIFNKEKNLLKDKYSRYRMTMTVLTLIFLGLITIFTIVFDDIDILNNLILTFIGGYFIFVGIIFCIVNFNK